MHSVTLYHWEPNANSGKPTGMVPLVPEAFTERPRTRGWLARVKASPAVARALSLARTPDPAASWSVGPEINRWG